MSKIVELVKYQLRIYFKDSRFIMPFVALAVFLYMMYSVSPAGIVGCFCVTCYMVFPLMAWVGFSVSSSENEVMEQILMLRVQSNTVYYMGKALFLIIIELLVDFICLVFPLAKNILSYLANKTFIFDRQLMGYDVLNIVLLLVGCSFVGGALGSLLHPCVIRDRKFAVLLTLLAVVLTVIRTSVIQEIPVFKLIAWVLPPIDKILIIYGSENSFSLVKTCSIFLPLMLYGVIYSLAKSVICCKRKFS